MVGQELSVRLGQCGHFRQGALWTVRRVWDFSPVTLTLYSHSGHLDHRPVVPVVALCWTSIPAVTGDPPATHNIRRRPLVSTLSNVRPFFVLHGQIALSIDIIGLHYLTGAVHRLPEEVRKGDAADHDVLLL